ncbi:hypothetical protein [Streptomyces pacificus]|uniref:Uncharacterized protein n=1 Tax=Streptomyces pacificus TaxID=2705029 RepID=A0A6A0AWD0_9ACTN|nr:hypothetical protein [Streptomyces pacificus]GFH36651.1 hypothetical protein SCWH03_28820 [Streptomyces pacificus]
MKLWDHATTTTDGRTGLITMDLGDHMFRVRFHHGRAPRPGLLSEATIRGERLRPATAEEKAQAVAAGLVRENERSGLRPAPKSRRPE